MPNCRAACLAVVLALAACGDKQAPEPQAKPLSPDEIAEQCVAKVEVLHNYVKELAAVESGASAAAAPLPEAPDGDPVRSAPIVFVGPAEVSSGGRLLSTVDAWSQDKTAAVEAGLREQLVRIDGSGVQYVALYVYPRVTWDVVAGLHGAIGRLGFVPVFLYRAPLGVRAPQLSPFLAQIDAIADARGDHLAARLATPSTDPQLKWIQDQFTEAFANCSLHERPTPPSSGAMNAHEVLAAWVEWVKGVPTALFACRCNIDMATAEAYVWAQLGAPRFRLVAIEVRHPQSLAVSAAKHKVTLPADTAWGDAAPRLLALDRADPFELLVP